MARVLKARRVDGKVGVSDHGHLVFVFRQTGENLRPTYQRSPSMVIGATVKEGRKRRIQYGPKL